MFKKKYENEKTGNAKKIRGKEKYDVGIFDSTFIRCTYECSGSI